MLKSALVQTDEQNSKCHGDNTVLAKVNQAFFDLFLEASESENKFFKIDETKKLTAAPITAIIAVISKSCRLIFQSKSIINNQYKLRNDIETQLYLT